MKNILQRVPILESLHHTCLVDVQKTFIQQNIIDFRIYKDVDGLVNRNIFILTVMLQKSVEMN